MKNIFFHLFFVTSIVTVILGTHITTNQYQQQPSSPSVENTATTTGEQDYYYDYKSSRLEELKILETNVCPRFEEHRNEYILDIKRSQARGAKLLDAHNANDLVKCASLCCNNPACDLGLFRVVGESSAGHNCYLVKCGNPGNCVMAFHQDFVSVMFKPTQQDEDITVTIGREHSPVENTQNNDVSQEEEEQQQEYQPPTDNDDATMDYNYGPTTTTGAHQPSDPTAAIHPTRAQTHSSASPGTRSTPEPIAITHSDATHPVSTNIVTTSSQNEYDQNATKPEIQANGNDAQENENSTQTLRPSVNVSDTTSSLGLPSKYHHDKDHMPTKDRCKGCDNGTGLIIVGVVGAIAVLAVLFAGLMITRRLYRNRQKKHYHNVDYLINGMYT